MQTSCSNCTSPSHVITDTESDKRTVKMAYLGPIGSYCHQGALIYSSKETSCWYELYPTQTIRRIFDEFRLNNQMDMCIVPYANSTNGSVAQTLEQIAETSSQNLMEICAEIRLPIRHCLAGRAQPTLRKANSNEKPYSNITVLRSHPQAWSQCTPFLDKHFDAQVVRFDEESTSSAAECVATDKTGTSAAICSDTAAILNGLDILASNIQRESNNETQFLVLTRKESKADEVSYPKEALLVYFATPNQIASVGKETLSLSDHKVYEWEGGEKGTWFYITAQLQEGGDAARWNDFEAYLKRINVECWRWGSWKRDCVDRSGNGSKQA